MRSFPLTVLNGGINRLRVKGGATASQLYDLQNAYLTNAGSIVPREGTTRVATLDSSTVGLAAANGVFNIFSSAYSTAALPANYVLNVLSNPNNTSSSPVTIFFAKPFMGFEYVVASFSDGSVHHYWLQNNGTWTSTTDYTSSSIVLPPTANGLAYQGVRDFPAQAPWTPETTITLNSFVEPNTPTGFAYKAIGLSNQNNCVLLLHCDGTNGSTTFVDSSPNNLTITAQPGATVATANPKFGTGALITTLGSYISSPPITTGSALDITTGDFTMEGWISFTDITQTSIFYQLSDAAGFGAIIRINASLMFATIWPGTNFVTNPTVLANNTYYHIALVRSGNNFGFAVNGVFGPTFVQSGALGTPNGSAAQFGKINGTGLLDEIRVSKTAVYTPGTNFTAPNAPFSISASLANHTGAVEPVWPTVDGGIVQEFGDFDTSVSDAGTTQAASPFSTASPLGINITDRYGDSATIANSGIFSTATSLLSTGTLASTKIVTWTAGTNYAPGAVVIPTTNQGAFINAIPNGDFEGGSGAGGWTFTNVGGSGAWAYSTVLPYQGTTCLGLPGGTTLGTLGARATMTSYSLVTPGQQVTVSAYINPNNNGATLSVDLLLRWYDSNDNFLSETGFHSPDIQGFGYRKVSTTGNAPANAAHVRVAFAGGSGTTSRNTGFVDLVTWNLQTPSTVTNFLYEAVQPTAASSAATQPTWPTTLGATVIDGGVTWKAIGTSIITWQAIPLMRSGANAPVFPTTIGNTVLDSSTFTDLNGNSVNTSMSWVTVDRHVSDVNCPNTIAVAIGASHVFDGSNDIVAYSAAVNPIDWTSTNNAGYLPTGLNNYGDNPVAMLALYRGNLLAFNASGYQMWQIDPDPQNMALLDAQPVGSTWPRAAQSVANDLLFLTEVGVRNLGTIGATANMAIGNTGQQVDPLIQAQLTSATYVPLSLYYPGRGQYWLIFGPQAFVLTINGTGTKSWSRYVFPQIITDWTLNAGILYLRTANNTVWKFDVNAVGVDDSNTITTAATPTAFNGVMQWPYLDLASLGINKMLVGVDVVGTGNCNIQIAFNQNDQTTFNDNPNFVTSTSITTPYFVQIDDTVPGEPLAFPINAPSYSPVLTFTGSTSSANAWSWQAMNIYFAPTPGTAAGATG